MWPVPISLAALAALAALALLAGSLRAAPALREAAEMGGLAANQSLVAGGNACGPAALLTAFRCGNRNWQRAGHRVAGATDKERLQFIIREAGMRPSKNLPGHPRWSRRGVGVADLRDMANELVASHYLPQLSAEVFYSGPRESPDKFLRRVHQRLDTSLAKGLPPILSLRRYALRRGPGGTRQWVVIDAHFITLTAMPRVLEKNAGSFAISYIDPLGGKRCQGAIAVSGGGASPGPLGELGYLEGDFPQTPVGKSRVKRGEPTVLAVAAAIGRW